jgi:deazaflavin-dependent oxidoreductase (nitroreductase family)
MHLPRRLARINRRVVNPIQRRYAGAIPGHGIVEHTGRRTGHAYRTPVLVFAAPGGFAMLVGYGLHSDWVQNVLAAQGGRLRHRRVDYTLARPRLLHGPDSYAELPRRIGRVARLLRVEGVLRVDAERAP